MTDITALPGDEQLLLTTLQGIVNRAGPRIYLVMDFEEGKRAWLDALSLPVDEIADPWDLLARYRSELRGVIIYDPAVPASINVALTLAGLEDAVVASPRLLERVGASLPILDDLRGRFASDLDAYAWQQTALWPRVNQRLLVAIPPARGGVPYGGLLQDYAVAKRAMTFWLNPGDSGERQLFASILAGARLNTPYLGWFPEDVTGEFQGVELTSAHGVYVLAADYCANLSVFSALPRLRARPQAQPITTPASPLENKIYLTLTFSEGDNLQYMQHRLRRLWDDPARGQIPLNWSVNPLADRLMPTILRHYLRTRTPNDTLVAGPSGAGYMYPDAWPADALPAFLRQSATAMRRTGIDAVWILNRRGGESQPLAPATVHAYREYLAPAGFLLNYEPYSAVSVLEGGAPQAITWGVNSAEDVTRAVVSAAFQFDGQRPLFFSLGLFAWSLTPSDIVALTRDLPPEYQLVGAGDFFRLVREANSRERV